jgi:hypothetical protein
MSHPLLPDLDATIDVDPREQALDLAGDEAALAEYMAAPGERVMFKVGYIKPPVFTSIRFRMARIGKPPDGDHESMLAYSESMIDVYRELCRWSLRGWNLDIPFPTEDEKVRGRTVKVAAESVIEAVEARGWLAPLGLAVLSYNTMDDDSKKK